MGRISAARDCRPVYLCRERGDSNSTLEELELELGNIIRREAAARDFLRKYCKRHEVLHSRGC